MIVSPPPDRKVALRPAAQGKDSGPVSLDLRRRSAEAKRNFAALLKANWNYAILRRRISIAPKNPAPSKVTPGSGTSGTNS